MLSLIFALLFAHGLNRSIDTSTCHCPKNDFTDARTDTVFRLSSGIDIALCGESADDGSGQYSEFVLAVCGSDSIIDFWGAAKRSRLLVQGDALIVESMEELPVGKNMRYRDVPWYFETITFVNGEVHREGHVNQKLRAYDAADVERVLKAYARARRISNDKAMVFANRLFIAAISGSVEARRQFLSLNIRWAIAGGAFEEEYDHLAEMLAMYGDD